MLLAIDVGNTNTVIGAYLRDGDGEMLDHFRIATSAERTADEYSVTFHALFGLGGLDTGKVRRSSSSLVRRNSVTRQKAAMKYALR